ncbi:hypothetical protein GCM10020258_23210 [Sphingomonas yabuuchiae]
MLAQHGGRIGVVVPYATFGTVIDLDRYAWLARRYEVGVVIDAAASLGTLDEAGRGFGTGRPSRWSIRCMRPRPFRSARAGWSIAAMPTGSTSCAMVNFGFESGRNATLPGINAKMPEILGLMARSKLAELDRICDARAALDREYRAALTGLTCQHGTAKRQATQFMPVLLPRTGLAPDRHRRSPGGGRGRDGAVFQSASG